MSEILVRDCSDHDRSAWSCDDRDSHGACRNPYGCHCREITAQRRRIQDLSAASSAAGGREIPEGWTLVPTEPTPEMLASGYAAYAKAEWDAGRAKRGPERESLPIAFRAMIAAALSPSQGSETGEAGREPGAYGIPGMPDRLSNSDRLRIFSAYHADRLPPAACAELVTMADEWDEEVEAARRDPKGSGSRPTDQAAAHPAPAGFDPSCGWRPIATAPTEGEFLVGLRVRQHDPKTRELLCEYEQQHVVSIDEETGEINFDSYQGWGLFNYEFWKPLDPLPASCDGSGEAGETGTGSTDGNSAVGAAETPEPPTAPQGADLAGLVHWARIPVDDGTRTLNDSALPSVMIWAGGEAYDDLTADKTLDLDSCALAVGVFRAMTKAAAEFRPQPPSTSAPPASADRIAPKTLNLIRRARQAAAAERALYGDSKDAGDLYDELADALGDALGKRREPPLERVRHIKSGGIYEVLCADAQIQTDTPLGDYAMVRVYRAVEPPHLTWVRPVAEMEDGRFEPAPPPAFRTEGERL